MDIIMWILFGLMVGIVFNTVNPSSDGSGIIRSILLGIVGALAGGFLANLIFGISIVGFDGTAFLMVAVGSLLLLFFGKTAAKT